MCGFGGGSVSTPTVQAAPTAPSIVAPIEADVSSSTASEEEKRRRRAASGRSDTVLTGGLGLTYATQAGGRTLLGG